MKLSAHNIIVPITESEDYLIVNPLHKSADIISKNELKLLTNKIDLSGEFAIKKYLINDNDENKAYKLSYLDFFDKRENDETQLFFIPNYSCNFTCSYCYQEEYHPTYSSLNNEIIDAFFLYINKNFRDKKFYITIFGGEPLLSGEKQRSLIEYIIKKANANNIDIAVVTNGYTLSSYVDILRKANIREIQVTLDGTQEIHDSRRYLKGNTGTFERIVAGIDACLQANIPINLRMVIDKENINNLVDFAQFAIDKKWTSSALFKTQIGRNYELHHCNSSPEKLFDRASLYKHLYNLIKQYPHIALFYKPSFSIAKYIAENEELPTPLFDSCPACKTEWAFDFTGTIYSCTATVGKKGEELGTFYPNLSLNKSKIEEWQNRDTTTIEECKSCEMALACGGGCASVAKNKHGAILSPDCRPIKELLSLGAAYYFTNK